MAHWAANATPLPAVICSRSAPLLHSASQACFALNKFQFSKRHLKFNNLLNRHMRYNLWLWNNWISLYDMEQSMAAVKSLFNQKPTLKSFLLWKMTLPCPLAGLCADCSSKHTALLCGCYSEIQPLSSVSILKDSAHTKLLKKNKQNTTPNSAWV